MPCSFDIYECIVRPNDTDYGIQSWTGFAVVGIHSSANEEMASMRDSWGGRRVRWNLDQLVG